MSDPATEPRLGSRIPIRNIWFLLVYAWDLARIRGRFDAAVEELDDSAALVPLIACLLCVAVEGRLRRNLSQGYVLRAAVMGRVRGRIDALATEAGSLLESGRVACRFEEMTSDTPRNRYVRAALARLAASGLPPKLGARSLKLARDLASAGIGTEQVTSHSLAREQFGRNDAEDRLMLEAARLAFELALPTDASGTRRLAQAERTEAWLRHLFERAVSGFYKAELRHAEGWTVKPSRPLDWKATRVSDGIAERQLLPRMVADLTIDHGDVRLVVDTKFTEATQANRWGREVFKSAHIYQLYSYLRSQAGRGCTKDDGASGMLLYPTISVELDEEVTIQGHRLRFATVNLASDPKAIASRLTGLVCHSSAEG